MLSRRQRGSIWVTLLAIVRTNDKQFLRTRLHVHHAYIPARCLTRVCDNVSQTLKLKIDGHGKPTGWIPLSVTKLLSLKCDGLGPGRKTEEIAYGIVWEKRGTVGQCWTMSSFRHPTEFTPSPYTPHSTQPIMLSTGASHNSAPDKHYQLLHCIVSQSVIRHLQCI